MIRTTGFFDRWAPGGVTWIYADRRSTEVSARLDRLCTRVFSNRDVAIYWLPDVP